MSTLRQERLAEAIIAESKKRKPKNKKDILVSSGYTESSAMSVPARIMSQKGVQDALRARGFTLDGAKQVVQSIMYSEKTAASDRLRATDQVFRVLGGYAPEKTETVQKSVSIAIVLDILEGKPITPTIAPGCPINDETPRVDV